MCYPKVYDPSLTVEVRTLKTLQSIDKTLDAICHLLTAQNHMIAAQGLSESKKLES